MEFHQFLQLLVDNGLTVAASFLSIVFGLILTVVQVKKYKFQSKENKLKYRTENYQSSKGYEPPAQSFKTIVPVYELDENSNELVVVGTKDLQELIQSARDCGLDIVLEKYGAIPPVNLPNAEVSENVFDATDVRDDLCILADFAEDIENMRIRYNMPMASFSELQEHIAKLQKDNDKKIQDELSKQKKEVSPDEV